MTTQDSHLIDKVIVVVEVGLVRNAEARNPLDDEATKEAVLTTVRDAIGGKHGLAVAVGKGPLKGHASLDYKKSGIRLEEPGR